MSIESGLIPLWFVYLMYLPCIGILLWALCRVNWTALKHESILQHVFYSACVALAVLWSIRAGLSSGLGIHFMGLTAATLVMGWPLALIAGALGLLGVSILGLEAFDGFAVNFMVSVALPVLTSYWVLTLVQNKLPANPFVYIFLCGFFNGAVSILAVACTTSLMLGLLEVYSWDAVYEEYFQYLPLMLFPEAFINGMVVAGVMGTFPYLLSSFNVEKYFSDD
ncbi:energy-coupling factor ABC transporter permease [Oceaniserpentilla sp. 4NH20-0058]|uniref:energy-coupling factor ABC transporter permease n=1 Tax=Oceaniserpentilla sp. 4NH20-0058 TaxID=3127660 RepID=UPI0031052D9E